MQPGSQLVITTDRSPRARAMLLGVALAAALAIPLTAAAGRNTASWIALNGAAGESLAASAQPALGSTVTFSVGYPNNVNNPRVEVLCYQAGELVFGMAGAVDYEFLLGGGGSTWKDRGGAAECVANLYYFSWKRNTPTSTTLASTSFSAGG
jgi:hypothetical protein